MTRARKLGFPALPDGRDEIEVLEFDGVHGHVDAADVDRLVLAGDEVWRPGPPWPTSPPTYGTRTASRCASLRLRVQRFDLECGRQCHM
jgi:hypothetical protein